MATSQTERRLQCLAPKNSSCQPSSLFSFLKKIQIGGEETFPTKPESSAQSPPYHFAFIYISLSLYTRLYTQSVSLSSLCATVVLLCPLLGCLLALRCERGLLVRWLPLLSRWAHVLVLHLPRFVVNPWTHTKLRYRPLLPFRAATLPNLFALCSI